MRLRRAPALILALGLIAAASAAAQDAKPAHGISAFGDLKYGPGFARFDYVNPAAPKGGAIRLYSTTTFDTFNPFLVKGVQPSWIVLTQDTLMARAQDEPDALYGLVAASIEVPPDNGWVAFNLRPEARFHGGAPMTSADVAYTFAALVKKGRPEYKLLFSQVARVETPTPRRIRFVFKPGAGRDLPMLLAGLPVVSKAYYEKASFDRTSLQPPLASGPYRIGAFEPGRYITYERIADYWGRDLPVNRGRFNFDRVRVDTFRDREVSFEAFFAGEYDFREEFVSRTWVTQYADKPAVKDKLVVRETLPDERPSGVQAFFFNMRRDRFNDRRVRKALAHAFDFEWTNRQLFYNLYRRTNSMFENSPLAAHDPPGAAELALLEPLRGKVPDEVFGAAPFRAPVTDGTGNMRANLTTARKLLIEAGWKVRNGRLVNAKGEPFTIEFLLSESTFQRIVNPYIRHLRRLGVDAGIRIVDSANFLNRRRQYDFDVVMNRFVQSMTPGAEQRGYFGSESADIPAALNYAGIKDPAVDGLIDKVVAAGDREALVAAVRALDRVLMWNYYVLPHWFKGAHNVAYWNKFDRPATKNQYKC
jgi:microcin C transport system substrate-binding protein